MLGHLKIVILDAQTIHAAMFLRKKSIMQVLAADILMIKVNLMKYQKSGSEFRTSAQLVNNLPNVVFLI